MPRSDFFNWAPDLGPACAVDRLHYIFSSTSVLSRSTAKITSINYRYGSVESGKSRVTVIFHSINSVDSTGKDFDITPYIFLKNSDLRTNTTTKS